MNESVAANMGLDSNDEPELKSSLSDDDIEYMDESPSRAEIGGFIAGLMNKKYLPQMADIARELDSRLRLQVMTIQAIMVNKGICGPDDFDKVAKEIVRLTEERNTADTEDTEGTTDTEPTQ